MGRRRRRLPRILLNAATVLSFALVLAVLATWPLSLRHFLNIGYQTGGGRVTCLEAERGWISVFVSGDKRSRDRVRSGWYAGMRPLDIPEVSLGTTLTDLKPAPWWCPLILDRYRSGALGVTFRYWLALAAAMVLPAIKIGPRIRARLGRAGRTGLCPACGYDLRATPDRCPECGSVPAPPSA